MQDAARKIKMLSKLARIIDIPWLKQAWVQRAILVISTIFIGVGIVLSIGQHPIVLTDLDPSPLVVVALALVPMIILLNVGEYLLTGRMLGRKIDPIRGFEITVIGAAANMLPLPGSTIVRVAGLKAAGASLGKSTLATGLVYVVWLGTSLIFAGFWMLSLDGGWTGEIFLATGFVLACVVVYAANRIPGGFKIIGMVAALRVVLVVIESFRLQLCLEAMGFSVNFAQAAGLSVTGVLGSAFSFVPAGLGVREAIAAGLSPIIGLSMSAGFLAVLVNRILGLLVVAPLGLTLAFRRRAL